MSETTQTCPSCQLSLSSANALLGPAPRLYRGLNDTLGLLDNSGSKKIQSALADLTRKFPQVNMHVVIRKLDPQFPVSTHMFWLFNQGDLSADDHKDGKNHTTLLALDPKQGHIGLMVGYGLEPFLPRKALDHVLEKAQPSLDTANYSKAILVVIHSLDDLMTGVCQGLEETLGISTQTASITQEY